MQYRKSDGREDDLKYKLKNYIYYDKLMADLEFNSKSAISKSPGETNI